MPSPVRLETAKIGAVGWPASASNTATSVFDRGAAVGFDAINLGDDSGDLGDADQFEDVEMFERLRLRSVIGGDDQQHPVD